MPEFKPDDSSSDDSTASGLSRSTQGTVPLSNVTTPGQDPESTTQVLKGDTMPPPQEPVQGNTSLHQVQGESEQSPAPVPAQNMEKQTPEDTKDLHGSRVPPSFDINSMKTYILETMKAKDLFGQAQITDPADLKDTIVEVAQSRMNEALSLLAYMDNHETEMLQLRNQIKEAGTTVETKKTEEATQEADAEYTYPLPEPELWKKEVKRKKRCVDVYGDIRAYDIDEVVTGGYDQPNFRTGGPILTHYRQLTNDTHTNQLEINSPLLIEVLRSAIDHYAGEDFKALKGDTVIFDEPYMMLFHNRKKLVDHANTLKDEARDQLMYLLDFLRQELPDISQKLDQIEEKKCKVIDFNTLWLLYKPSVTVFTHVGQEWRAFRVARLGGFKQSTNGVWSALQLKKTWMTMSAGNALASRTRDVRVANFDSETPIADLEYVPEGYLLNELDIREQLISRGEKYWSLRDKSSYLDYTGSAWVKTMESVSTTI